MNGVTKRVLRNIALDLLHEDILDRKDKWVFDSPRGLAKKGNEK